MNISITQITLNLIASSMLVLGFFMVGRMRLRSMLAMFSWQSACLAVFAGIISRVINDPQLLITASLTLFLKAWMIPRLFIYSAEHSQASQRLQSFLRPEAMLFVSLLIVLMSFNLTHSLLLFTDPAYPIVSIAVSLVLLGILMLILRKDLYSQMAGFLMMENGIFLFGLALTGGMPLIVELGIFFDVTAGALFMAALSYRVQQVHDRVTTDALSELID